MATAPRPGIGARKTAERDALRGMRLTINGESREYYPALVTLSDKAAIRKALGMGYEALLADANESMGEDILAVLWWLAGRHDTPSLSWQQVVAAWPDTIEDIDVEWVVPDGGEDEESPEE